MILVYTHIISVSEGNEYGLVCRYIYIVSFRSGAITIMRESFSQVYVSVSV